MWKPFLEPLPTTDHQLGTHTTLNQGPPMPGWPDMQTTPYYHPFSSPLAAAMMVAHHSGVPMQSSCKTDQTAHLLGSLGSELNASDLLDFSIAIEHKKLDDYVTSILKNMFQHEDGWCKSSVQI